MVIFTDEEKHITMRARCIHSYTYASRHGHMHRRTKKLHRRARYLVPHWQSSLSSSGYRGEHRTCQLYPPTHKQTHLSLKIGHAFFPFPHSTLRLFPENPKRFCRLICPTQRLPFLFSGLGQLLL